MRITVFGASGRVGRRVVAEASARGHAVTAFVRDAAQRARLEDAGAVSVVVGALTDEVLVGAALEGSDAVISALGAGARPSGTQLSDGIRVVVAEAQRAAVPRLVVLSTASVIDPLDGRDPRFAALVSAVTIVFPGAYRETVRIGEIVRSSDTGWMLVRVGLLGGRDTGRVRVGHYGVDDLGMRISRAALARYLVDLAESREHERKTVAVSS